MRRWKFAAAALAAAAIAWGGSTAGAEPSTPAGIDTRLSVLEARLARIELDVNRLVQVPTSQARLETKLDALTERSEGLSGTWSTLTTGLIMALLGGAIGRLYQRNKDAGA